MLIGKVMACARTLARTVIHLESIVSRHLVRMYGQRVTNHPSASQATFTLLPVSRPDSVSDSPIHEHHQRLEDVLMPC
jgi:hypothetical protein